MFIVDKDFNEIAAIQAISKAYISSLEKKTTLTLMVTHTQTALIVPRRSLEREACTGAPVVDSGGAVESSSSKTWKPRGSITKFFHQFWGFYATFDPTSADDLFNSMQ